MRDRWLHVRPPPKPFDMEARFKAVAISPRGRCKPAHVRVVANSVIGGNIPVEVEVPVPMSFKEDPFGGDLTLIGNDADGRRWEARDVLILSYERGGSRRETIGYGLVHSLRNLEGNRRSPTPDNVDISACFGSWEYLTSAAEITKRRATGDREFEERPANATVPIEIPGGPYRLLAFEKRHSELLGSLAVPVAEFRLTPQLKTFAEIRKAHGPIREPNGPFVQAAERFALIASLAGRVYGPITQFRTVVVGTEGRHGIQVDKLYRPSRPWSEHDRKRGRSFEYLIPPDTFTDFVSATWDRVAHLQHRGLWQAVVYLCQHHEETEFTRQATFLFMALEATVACLAEEFGFEKVRGDSNVRLALRAFKQCLDAIGSENAQIVGRKLGELCRPAFGWQLARIAEKVGLQTADLGGMPNIKLRNHLFHGAGIEVTPTNIDEVFLIRCMLERLLLRAVGWGPERRSDVDGMGVSLNTVRAILNHRKKQGSSGT